MQVNEFETRNSEMQDTEIKYKHVEFWIFWSPVLWYCILVW